MRSFTSTSKESFSESYAESFLRASRILPVSRDRVDAVIESWQRELPGVTGAGLALGKRAHRLTGLLNAPVEGELARMGLTKGEYDILSVLRVSGRPYRLRPSDIAQRLLLSSGGTSNLLRRLTDAGLVERDAHPSDARSSWVRLSAAGVTTTDRIVRAASTVQAELLAKVPEKVQRQAIEALRALLVALGDVPDA
jgi:DNA-binding MarR family transcriptional regulator